MPVQPFKPFPPDANPAVEGFPGLDFSAREIEAEPNVRGPGRGGFSRRTPLPNGPVATERWSIEGLIISFYMRYGLLSQVSSATVYASTLSQYEAAGAQLNALIKQWEKLGSILIEAGKTARENLNIEAEREGLIAAIRQVEGARTGLLNDLKTINIDAATTQLFAPSPIIVKMRVLLNGDVVWVDSPARDRVLIGFNKPESGAQVGFAEASFLETLQTRVSFPVPVSLGERENLAFEIELVGPSTSPVEPFFGVEIRNGISGGTFNPAFALPTLAVVYSQEVNRGRQ
jgi:hypothetical protein